MRPPPYLFSICILLIMSCNEGHKPEESDPVEFVSNVYPALQVELEAIFDSDQGIREERRQMNDFDGQLDGKMHRIDSVNQKRVGEILASNGWIPESKIGQKASDAIFLVVQHGDIETMEKYFPSLKQLADKGEARMTHAAMMEDRILMYRGKKQIYGTQASRATVEDGSSRGFIWPIVNPENVNTLRQKAGFEMSVEEYAQRLNVEYNPNESLPSG